MTNPRLRHNLNALQNVTNEEFLSNIFGEDWGLAHVTAFSNDPSDIAKEFRGACWGGGAAKDRLSLMSSGQNQYFTISLFDADNVGKARRQKALFNTTWVIVADDIGEKIGFADAAKLPAPSYKLQTSQDSEHWGWILETPCDNRAQVENLVDGWVSQGLCSEGVDTGMKGVTRYMRLPEGSNTKAKRLDGEGLAFKCLLTEWNPDRTFTLDDLAAPFGIDVDADRNETIGAGVALNDLSALRHPILDLVEIESVTSDNWLRLAVCPNSAAHTEGVDGSAIQIQEDGRIEFSCHHGSCQGANGGKKMTGPMIVKLLDKEHEGFEARYFKHMENLKTQGMQALIAATTAGMGDDDDLDRLMLGGDGEVNALVRGMNPRDYVFMKGSSTYYELSTSTDMSSSALDSLWLAEHTGGKGDPKASRLFDLAKDRETMTADGFLWRPDTLVPVAPRVIKHDGRQLINEWRGLALSPIEGDVQPWTDLVRYLIPDDRTRQCVMQWMANLFLNIGEKPSWQLLIRGSLRNGKDSIIRPLAQILGARGASDIRSEDIDAGWGDPFYAKKLTIFQEIWRPNDRQFANTLKTYCAPTATGTRDYNIKKGGVKTGVDCSAVIGMSNHRACIAVDQGEERYFVIDCFIPPLEADFYRKYYAWLNAGGAGAVLHYLLNDVDMAGFNAGKLPYVTEGAVELMALARPDFEHAIEDLIAENVGVFALPVFTLAQAKAFLLANGHKMGRNSLETALANTGYHKHKGIRKIDGKTHATPAFFSVDPLEARSSREIYDAYFGALDNQKELAKFIDGSC